MEKDRFLINVNDDYIEVPHWEATLRTITKTHNLKQHSIPRTRKEDISDKLEGGKNIIQPGGGIY